MESRMTELEEMRRKEEKRVARKTAMISNIKQLLNFRGRRTPLPYTAEQVYHQKVGELEQSIDQVRVSTWWIDDEMEDLDRTEYGGPGS